MKTAKIKPAAGLKVRDPITGKHLAAAGEEKPLTSYWRRRLKDGDAVLADEKKAGKGKPKSNEE